MGHKHIPFIFLVIALGFASCCAWACHSKNANDSVVAIQSVSEVPDTIAITKSDYSESGDPASKWADSIMQILSLRQRIAQLFVPRLDISNNVAGYRKIDQMMGVEQMGGFLLGKGSIQAYADLINRGQSKANVPLLITLDGEWGLSMRISSTPRFPYNVALGAADDEELMYLYGNEVARECRLMGIQVDFAPDLDVNSNPDNPVIGYRSFGEDPDLVGRLGAAYCKGMADGGVMPVGKHFPGHGDTSTDSHKTLPIVDHSVDKLKAVDLKPFEMCIKAGMPGVMVGHLKVPALDKSGTPSSLSKIITTDWLRDSLDFQGVIFTDALAMKGASGVNENNCVSAFLAGADVLLGSSNPIADLNAVEAAVKSGKIKESEVDRRCKKLLICKYKLGLSEKPHVNASGMGGQLNTPSVDSLISAMSRKAITVLKNENNLLPLDKKSSVVVVNLGAPANNMFSNRCSALGDIKTFTIDGSSTIPSAITKAADNANAVIIAVYKDASWSRAALNSLSSRNNSVGVFFINPFKAAKFSGIGKLKSTVFCYDDIPQLRGAAAEAIYGVNPVTGKLPINLPGVAKIGQGIKL